MSLAVGDRVSFLNYDVRLVFGTVTSLPTTPRSFAPGMVEVRLDNGLRVWVIPEKLSVAE